MGVTFSENLIQPICACCDNFVKYVLNGCKSECGVGSCCACKIEVIDHDADEFFVSEGDSQQLSEYKSKKIIPAVSVETTMHRYTSP